MDGKQKMNDHKRRKTDDSFDYELELQVVIQRLSDQVSRIVSDAESEKESRRRTNDAITKQIESIRNDVKQDFRDLRNDLRQNYVSSDQFYPIKKFVYGFTAIALGALILAVISFFLRDPHEPPSYPRDGGAEVKPDSPP